MALTGQELCNKLSIDSKQLSRWVREGLPSTGRGKSRRFDPVAVREWLIATGKAEVEPPAQQPAELPTDQPIAHTWAQVAEYFQVSERTVATWIKQGMPGKSGRPGTKEGQFPLFDIEAWREGRKLANNLTTNDETKNQSQARLFAARAELLELELAKARSELVDAAEVARRWIRVTHEAKSQFTQLPAAILKSLPDSLPIKLRRKVRSRVQQLVDRSLATLELFLEAEAADAESVEKPTEPAADGKSDD